MAAAVVDTSSSTHSGRTRVHALPMSWDLVVPDTRRGGSGSFSEFLQSDD